MSERLRPRDLAFLELETPTAPRHNCTVEVFDPGDPSSAGAGFDYERFVALILDLRLRAGSEGRRSLDDVMRALWERFGKADVGFTPEQFEALGQAMTAIRSHLAPGHHEIGLDD